MSDEAPSPTAYRVENSKIDDYAAYLKDKYRPPSRGGNTQAWHQHVIKIGKDTYSWLGLGTKKWIFAGDTVSFTWSFDKSGKYRNVDPDSIEVHDKDGNEVIRGERGSKKWRTASTRLPASRREWRD
jgi:hypothetical protein